MAALLEARRDISVSGTVSNPGRFYDRFEHALLLSAPLSMLLDRIARRTSNPYGKSEQQRAQIADDVEVLAPLLRRRATMELDTAELPPALADRIAALMTPST